MSSAFVVKKFKRLWRGKNHRSMIYFRSSNLCIIYLLIWLYHSRIYLILHVRRRYAKYLIMIGNGKSTNPTISNQYRFFWMREVGMISRQARHWVTPKPKVLYHAIYIFFCVVCSCWFECVINTSCANHVFYVCPSLIVYSWCSIHQCRSRINRFSMFCASIRLYCFIDHVNFGDNPPQPVR